MKLIDYMRQEGLDDRQMAESIGQCSSYAVKKWKYGERTPRPEQLARIVEATAWKVTPNDFMDRAVPPAAQPEVAA